MLSQFVYDRWGLEEGLPQLSVQAIEQTQDGYLWLGTQEGLARFDGYSMTVFDKTSLSILKTDFIKSLFEDSRQRLWIGSSRGALYYQEGRFVSLIDAENGPRERIYAIAETVDGAVWFGAANGLYRYQDQRFQKMSQTDGPTDETVNALEPDPVGGLWIGSEQGLYQWKDGQFFYFSADDGLPGKAVNALCSVADGSLWVGGDAGLSNFRSGRFKRYTVEDGLLSNNTLSLLEDRDGVLWVGSDTGVCRIYRGAPLKEVRAFAAAIEDEIIAFEEDREGGVWIGAWNQGLHRVRDGLITPFGKPEGLPSGSTRAVLQSRDGSVWVGSVNGLTRMSPDGSATIYNEENGLSDANVYCLLEDRNGAIWAGARYGGLNRIFDGRVQTFDSAQGLSDNAVRTLHEDSKGNIWIGLGNNGLDLYQNERFFNFSPQDGLNLNVVNMIAEDRDGRIWVGGLNGGVDILDNGSIRNLSAAEGLPGDNVFAFHQETNGDIWLGTNDGLVLYRNESLFSIGVEQGLFSSIVYAIVDDRQGRFWMSCNKGIFSVDKLDLYDLADGKTERAPSRKYGVADGMRSPECNFGGSSSGAIDDRGRLLFPTAQGLATFHPGTALADPPAPAPIIETIVADGKSQPLRDAAPLGPGLANLEIHYTAPYLSNPDNLYFRYRLEGQDSAWRFVTRRAAYYNNLPPRDYAFRLEARIGEGPWTPMGEPVRLKVQPRYYQTGWFRGTVLAAALALAIFVLWGWNRAALSRQRKLERLVDKKTNELAEVQEQRARDAHQAGMSEIAVNVLHNMGNALNSVNVTADIIEQDVRNFKVDFLRKVVDLLQQNQARLPEFLETDERGQKILPALAKVAESLRRNQGDLSEKLTNLRDQVIRMNSIVHAQKNHIDNIGLFNETVDLNRLINEILEVQMANPDHAVNVIRAFQPLPRLKTQKSKLTQVLFYLIDNAFESLQMREDINDRLLRVVTKKIGGDMALIELTDNGVGIPEDRIERIFFDGYTDKPGASGFGLHYTANAVREMRGRIRAYSRGKDLGATFVLELPLDPEKAPPLFELSKNAAAAVSS